MVLPVLSVRPGGTRFFALAERKKRNTKEDEVPLAKGWIADCASPLIECKELPCLVTPVIMARPVSTA
jgi:hypothetical protein